MKPVVLTFCKANIQAVGASHRAFLQILAAAIFAFGLLPAFSQTDDTLFDCDLLLGRWVGNYTYPNGDYYSWRADLDESGQWDVYFYDRAGQQTDFQEGFWECDGELLTTWIEEGLGPVYVNQYRILELTRAIHTYEYISGPVPGPIYRAVRDRLPFDAR